MTGREPLVLLVVGAVLLVLSGIGPHDRTTWLLEGADAFLGTQGDHWDTQWDMFLALLRAATALLALSRLHERQINSLEETSHV